MGKGALGIVALVCLLGLGACGKEEKAGEGGGGGGGKSAKPTPGDPCTTDGERTCLSPEQQAICQGGQWRAFPCSGPNACASSGGTTTCDISGNKVDDNCAAADNKKNVCGGGGKEWVSCVDGKIKRQQCRGPKGCTADGDKFFCDQSINNAGDPCSEEGTSSCTPDQKNFLKCQNGQWIASFVCRGPKGCALDTTTNQVNCDTTVAVVGDACWSEGAGTCSQDGKGELVCKNGKYVWYYKGKCRY